MIMVLLVFFIVVCVIEVLCLVVLGFAWWGLVRLERKLHHAHRKLYTLKTMFKKRLKLGEVGVSFASNGLKTVGLFMPWWARAFFVGFKWVGRAVVKSG